MSRIALVFLLLLACAPRKTVIPSLSGEEVRRRVKEKLAVFSGMEGHGKIVWKGRMRISAYGSIRYRENPFLLEGELKGFLGIVGARLKISHDSAYVYLTREKKYISIDTLEIVRELGKERLASIIAGKMELPEGECIAGENGYWLLSPSLDVCVNREFLPSKLIVKTRRLTINVELRNYRKTERGYFPFSFKIEAGRERIMIDYDRVWLE